jgi:hypothetical protein
LKATESNIWDSETRMTVLVRASSNLAVSQTDRVIHRKTNPFPHQRGNPTSKTRTCLEKKKKLGHGSWRDLKPRMTVLARASRNLTNPPTDR